MLDETLFGYTANGSRLRKAIQTASKKDSSIIDTHRGLKLSEEASIGDLYNRAKQRLSSIALSIDVFSGLGRWFKSNHVLFGATKQSRSIYYIDSMSKAISLDTYEATRLNDIATIQGLNLPMSEALSKVKKLVGDSYPNIDEYFLFFNHKITEFIGNEALRTTFMVTKHETFNEIVKFNQNFEEVFSEIIDSKKTADIVPLEQVFLNRNDFKICADNLDDISGYFKEKTLEKLGNNINNFDTRLKLVDKILGDIDTSISKPVLQELLEVVRELAAFATNVSNMSFFYIKAIEVTELALREKQKR